MGMVGLVLLCAYFAHVWKGFRALSVDPSLSPTLRGFYLGAVAGLASLLIAARHRQQPHADDRSKPSCGWRSG